MNAYVRRFTVVAGVLGALAPALASAQMSEPHASRISDYGAYVLFGGGVTNYTAKDVRDRLDAGGTWDIRMGVGNRYYIGGELAYVGSARNGGDFSDKLVTNGAEAVLRLQYPWETGRWLVEPFAFGGAGWTHFNLTGVVSSAALKSTDDVFEMPVGGGVTVVYDHILLDTRFTYRQTFDENLIKAADGNAASLNSWAVTASIGYEF